MSKVLFWLLCFCAISLGITWYMDISIGSELLSYQTFSATISILSTLTLLGISLELFNKFTGSQKILDEQTKVVIDLVTYLSELSFLSRSLKTGHRSIIFDVYDFRERLKLASVKKLIKSSCGDESILDLYIEIGGFSKNPYLPRKLAAALNAEFEFNFAGILQKPDLRGDNVVRVNNTKKSFQQSPSLISYINNEELDFEKIVLKIEKTYKEAEKWLRQNSPITHSTLNIRTIS